LGDFPKLGEGGHKRKAYMRINNSLENKSQKAKKTRSLYHLVGRKVSESEVKKDGSIRFQQTGERGGVINAVKHTRAERGRTNLKKP